MTKQEIEQQRREEIRERLSANKRTWLESLKAEKESATPEISAALEIVIANATKEV